MKCPWCFSYEGSTVVSHMNKEIMTPDRGLVIQRKRRCKVCKAAFSTVEYISFRDREKINGQGGGQK